MLFADPLKPEHGKPADAVVSAGVGNFFQHFENECFVIADRVPGKPNAAIAARLALETAFWGYKLVRQRRSYWRNRDAFLKRIFRSTNISLWQKHREVGFESGLTSSLLVCMFRGNNYWVGSTGTISGFLLRDGELEKLTKEDVDSQGYVMKMVGKDRFGLVPRLANGPFKINDTILLATSNVVRSVSEQEMQSVLEAAGSTVDSLATAVDGLLAKAKAKKHSSHFAAAVVIKRVKT